MKIVHLCLCSFYIDGYSYQENELVAQHVADGHEVTVIASTESLDENRKTVYLPPGEYCGADGARVVRLAYRKLLPHSVMRKVRMHPSVYRLLEQYKPDVILFHGTGGWELITAVRYSRNNPHVKLYVDSHTDAINSAQSNISRWFLHGFLYKQILWYALTKIEKILCVNLDAMNFASEVYKIPKDKLEFFPLGGKVLDDNEYESRRKHTRRELGLDAEDIAFIQSGKMDSRKKVVESVRAFIAASNERCVFFLVGHLHEEIADEVTALMAADSRIKFLGWKDPEQLRNLLCAADIYVQPGTQSATMQMSLCCRCAVILDDVTAHRVYVQRNGWLVKDENALRNAIAACATNDKNMLELMSESSRSLASEMLDYRNLAARICH